MPKSTGLRKFFAQAKKTVPVTVGDKRVNLTTTQAVRLDELAATSTSADTAGPALDRSPYTLEEAALRLLQSEAEVLKNAVIGRLPAYVAVSGLAGRWMVRPEGGDVRQSAVQTLASGYLAILPTDLDRLRSRGHCDVSVLELKLPANAEDAGIPEAVLAALETWGDGNKAFRLESPLAIDANQLRFIPPLRH